MKRPTYGVFLTNHKRKENSYVMQRNMSASGKKNL